MLVSGMEPSDSDICFRFFSMVGYYKILTEFPVLYSKLLLVIYFIYSNMYILVPNSKFILPTPFPLVTISLFPMSLCLLVFCK